MFKSRFYSILFIFISLLLFILGIFLIDKTPFAGFFIGSSFSCFFAVGYYFRQFIYEKEKE